MVERRAGLCQNRDFPTGLWTLSRLLIRAKVWNALCTLGPTQQGLQSRGMSIQDICLAAGWSSQNTFARFYKRDVQSLASPVLSVSTDSCLLPLFAGVAARTVIYAALYDIAVFVVCPEFSAASIVHSVLCCLTQLSLCQPLAILLMLLSCPVLSAAHFISDRYVNLVYLGFSAAIGGNDVWSISTAVVTCIGCP